MSFAFEVLQLPEVQLKLYRAFSLLVASHMEVSTNNNIVVKAPNKTRDQALDIGFTPKEYTELIKTSARSNAKRYPQLTYILAFSTVNAGWRPRSYCDCALKTSTTSGAKIKYQAATTLAIICPPNHASLQPGSIEAADTAGMP